MERANRVTASAFLDRLCIAAVPYKIHTILTDNGIQFRYAPRYVAGIDGSLYDAHVRHALSRERHRAPLHQNQPSLDHGQESRRMKTRTASRHATVKRYHYDSHDQLQQASSPTSSARTISDGD